MAGSAADPPAASRRSVEIGTAATLAVAGGIFSAASLAHDIGWSATGPGAGYFPFRIGVLLTLAGVAVAIQSAYAKASAGPGSAYAKASAGPGSAYAKASAGPGSAYAKASAGPAHLGARPDAVFATRPDLRRTLGVALPTAALAVGTMLLGSYVASGLFLAFMLRRHGGYGWLPAAAFGAVSVAVFYMVFDVWFRVPLAKGPLEAVIGL